MKMLQALVGYLAVTALPFYPFAFAASQLESINYDGYANNLETHIDGALMKQVIGSIVESCQTITTPKHSDGTFKFMKHHDVSGDILEARQEVDPSPTPIIIGVIIIVVILGIIWIVDDNSVRGKDVEILVEHLTRVFY